MTYNDLTRKDLLAALALILAAALFVFLFGIGG